MSDQNKPRNALSDEQLSDILLVVDKKNKTLDAVKDIDKKGKVQTVPANKENESEFMKIGQNSDPLDIAVNAIKNFYQQALNPTEFAIYRVPLKVFNGIKNTTLLLNELLKKNPSKSAREFADTYLVENQQVKSAQNETHKKQETMAKNENVAEAQQPAQTESKPRFNESMIDWKSIESFGISRDFLKDKGLLDGMLRGYKTSQLVSISININNAMSLRTDARLSFQQSVGGPVQLAVHGLRQEPQLQRPYFGHIFSEEDKKNLRESGNMGRSVELKNRNGETHPYLISIDKLTNEIVATRADTVFIPDEVKGIKLDDQDKAQLREGKQIFVDKMTSQNGKEFSAHLQINADRRGIEFIFPENSQQKIQMIGGVQLTPQQQLSLNEGRAIFVEDMQRKDGELFSSFIKKDPTTNNFSYTRYNPDSPEGAREIYIPKEIGGVKLTGEERDLLREGQPIFLDKMVNRRGEEFSSYIKVDTETGRMSYARRPDDFAHREQFKVPADVFGVTLNTTQRAQLQDGKAVLIEGMKGFDGKEFSSYVKVNANQGKLDYYNDNPDKPKNGLRSSGPAERAQTQSAAQDNKPKARRGQRV